MENKKSLSIRWLLILSFSIPVLFIIFFSFQNIKQALHVSNIAKNTQINNNLIDITREVDEDLARSLFLGLKIINKSSNIEDNKATLQKLFDKITSNTEKLSNYIKNEHSPTLQKTYALKVSLSEFKKAYSTLIDKKLVSSESWIENIDNLSFSLEKLRILLSTPMNSGEFILYQQLVIRNTAIKLYTYTIKEATILSDIIDNQNLDNAKAEQIILIRQNAAKQRDILKLIRVFLGEIMSETNLQDKFLYLSQGSQYTIYALGIALEEPTQAFEIFDELRREIYASTLIDASSSPISQKSWNNELKKILSGLKRVEEQVNIPLHETIEEQKTTSQNKLLIVITSTAIVTLILIVLFIKLNRRALIPIGTITESMKKLAEGDTKSTLPDIAHQDEVGKMLEALKVFRKNAEDLVEHRDYLQKMVNKVEKQKQDITLAKEEAERFAMMPKNNPNPVVKINDTGEILLSNDPTKKLFPNIAKLGLLHPILKGVVEIADKQDVSTREVTIKGSTYLQKITNAIVAGKKEIIIYSTDITSLKEAQEEAEHANKLKSEFLTNISHELRTPMHAILGFSRQGIKNIDKWTTEKLGQNLQFIRDSGERLLYLLNNLLDLSKLESGSTEYDMQKTDIKSIIDSGMREFQSLIDDNKLKVQVNIEDNLPEIEMDKEKITQVFLNFLSNAIKFTPENKNIKISCIIDKKISSNVILSVSDEGVGIPEDELESVFDKFIQSSKTKTGAGGTGLGLAICKEIINDHNGTIWAKNNSETGAIFSFSIPITQSSKNL